MDGWMDDETTMQRLGEVWPQPGRWVDAFVDRNSSYSKKKNYRSQSDLQLTDEPSPSHFLGSNPFPER